MKITTIISLLAIFCFIELSWPGTSHAIPPPDFIVNAGSQLAQWFAIALFLFSTAGSFILARVRSLVDSKFKKLIALALILGGFALSCLLYLRF